MNKYFKSLKKPELYAKSTNKFWDDEHISKGMLKAHLTPTLDAATRPLDYVEKSISWISENAPLPTFRQVLDIGCGPGLYANRLNKLGYSVTGIDYSKRSIDYAKKQNKDNTYLYQDYLNIDYKDRFDLILLIYCDYGALSFDERKLLLDKAYKALKKGGKFIFDVFTPVHYKHVNENQTWSFTKETGFWRPNSYLSLSAHYIYKDDIHLNQYVIVEENNKADIYRIWDTCFTKGHILNELKDVEFNNITIYGDVKGTSFDEQSETMGIVLEK